LIALPDWPSAIDKDQCSILVHRYTAYPDALFELLSMATLSGNRQEEIGINVFAGVDLKIGRTPAPVIRRSRNA